MAVQVLQWPCGTHPTQRRLAFPPLFLYSFYVWSLLLGSTQRFFIGQAQPVELVPERLPLEVYPELPVQLLQYLLQCQVVLLLNPSSQRFQVRLQPRDPSPSALQRGALSGLPFLPRRND